MSQPIVYTYTAGEAIGAGIAVQHDPLNEGEVLICTDGTIATAQQIVGITKHGAAIGDPIDVVISGEVIAKSGATFGAAIPQRLAVGGGAGGLVPYVAGLDQVIAHAVGNIDASTINAAGMDIKVLVVPSYDG